MVRCWCQRFGIRVELEKHCDGLKFKFRCRPPNVKILSPCGVDGEKVHSINYDFFGLYKNSTYFLYMYYCNILIDYNKYLIFKKSSNFEIKENNIIYKIIKFTKYDLLKYRNKNKHKNKEEYEKDLITYNDTNIKNSVEDVEIKIKNILP